MERSLVGFHGRFHLFFHFFSSAFRINKPEVWIAFLPTSLTKQSWQEKKKRERMSNCGRKVIKKNN